MKFIAITPRKELKDEISKSDNEFGEDDETGEEDNGGHAERLMVTIQNLQPQNDSQCVHLAFCKLIYMG